DVMRWSLLPLLIGPNSDDRQRTASEEVMYTVCSQFAICFFSTRGYWPGQYPQDGTIRANPLWPDLVQCSTCWSTGASEDPTGEECDESPSDVLRPMRGFDLVTRRTRPADARRRPQVGQ